MMEKKTWRGARTDVFVYPRQASGFAAHAGRLRDHGRCGGNGGGARRALAVVAVVHDA